MAHEVRYRLMSGITKRRAPFRNAPPAAIRSGSSFACLS
jgi:hypothetical protein